MSSDVAVINVTKEDVKKEYNLPINTTIEELKNKIISDFRLSVKYIDIDFLLERPIRTLGLFNVEPGILARPLDMYPLERFGLAGRNVTITFIEVDNYTPFKNNRGKINLRRKVEDKKETNTPYFNLESETDFPTL